MDESPRIFVVLPETTLGISLNETISYFGEEFSEGSDVILPIKCKNCGHISLKVSSLEHVSTNNNRQMGPELFYTANLEETECTSCGNQINIMVDISTYAGSWSVDDYTFDGCDLIFIEALERTLDNFSAKAVKAYRLLEDLYEERAYLKEEVKSLQELAEKKIHLNYILVVEGPDDVDIWTGLLLNKSLDPQARKIHIIRGARKGGRSEAIAAFDTVKRLPVHCKKKLVVDSDNDEERAHLEIKNANFTDNEYYVLSVKEMETHLLNAHAISLVTGVDEKLIIEKMQTMSRRGKEGLEQLFLSLGLGKISAQTKLLIAKRLPSIPSELERILDEIRRETVTGPYTT